MLATGPLITEFVAINETTLADGDGVFSDWIEIHNPTSSAVSLDGWHLTDDRNDLTQWPLPDVSLAGGEYLVVFASGQAVVDYVDGGGNFHTNFKLNGNGEDLLLVEPDGVTYDPTFLDYPPQSADVSYGISIDGVSETLVGASDPLAYRVPTAGEDVTAWTAVGFDDSGFANEQTVAGSGLLITEVDTGDEKKFVEIQNVSAEAIDTTGWTVAINDPIEGPSGVVGVAWDLPASVAAAEIRYRTDQATDQYWGSAIPWQLEGPGWAMIVDDVGTVRDFVAWGYTAAEIATINIDVGTHSGITVADQWNGDGAEVGATGGVAIDPVAIGPGSDLAGATSVDSAGIRLNVEPTFMQTLPAGTYNVQDVSFAANSTGAGQLRAFLAVLTGGGPTYETIWASPAATPPAGDSTHTVEYPAGSQQFTLASETDVYAGAWHDGNAKVKFSNLATVTNHDSSPITPTAAGQTIGDFSHGGLNNRTYAYHVTVNSGLGATTSLARVGVTDDDSPSDFVRNDAPTVGTQNPDSAPLFGGVVPTIGGIGFDGGDPLFADLIQTDVAAAMHGINASLWTRFEFASADMTGFDELTFRVRYDDGFQAYLDGVPLAARNAPGVLAVDSTATAPHANAAAVQFEDIDVSAALAQLAAGDHVLAVHALNVSAADADLLLQVELSASSEGAAQFFADATPGQASTAEGFNTVADTEFSMDRGFYDAPFDVEISTDTVGAKIVYTLDGRPPEVGVDGQIVHGAEYVAPLTIDGTTTLRAMAVKQGLMPTDVDTQTYLFTADVAGQTHQATIDAGFPPSWGSRGADYGIDPDVVGPNDLFGGVYAASFADDLLELPTLSLVLDTDGMFGSNGIYSNATSRGYAWERPVSAELIYPDGQDGFQVDAGIRVHGGASRSLSRKNSLRLVFREEYGPTKLDYPLFGDGVDRFDTVVLRAHFNDGWGWSGAAGDPLFSRDEWHRQTQSAMGHVSSRGIGMHLYINGIYWGIYNPSERPDGSFGAQHFGGDKTEWDSINHGGVSDGNATAWNTMLSMTAAVNNASGDEAKWAAYQALQGNGPDGSDDPLLEDYLDVENYIDYMLLNFYSGNHDWAPNNWYAARRRGPESEGFQFFAWDSEISMTLSSRTHLNENRTNVTGGVAAPYASLRNYDEFQLAFADRVEKHFAPGGVFYVDPVNPAVDPAHPERNVPGTRFAAIAAAVSDAVVTESARWGDQHRSTPYTRNAEWQTSLDYMMSVYFPQRTAIVMPQLRAAGLFPELDAPEFNQHGGVVPPGFELEMSADIDQLFVETTVLAAGDPAVAFVPSDASLETGAGPYWYEEAFVPTGWLGGPGGVGYEDSVANYDALIGLDVQTGWDTYESSLYTRFNFSLDAGFDPTDYDQLLLRMKYDDGFVAYLNGTRVEDDLQPATIDWQAHATGQRSDTIVTADFVEFDITSHLGLLHEGVNVLAVHGLNDGDTSSDMLILPELVLGELQSATSAPIYFTTDGSDPRAVGGEAVGTLYENPLTINQDTVVMARALFGGQWSALNEALYVVNPASSDNVVVSEINFNPAPPTTTELAQDATLGDDDFEFVELTNISAEAVSLADVAFVAGDPVEFAFADGSVFSLDAGESVLVVRDLDAFRIRYGTGLDDKIAGVFADGGLNNGGEQITLLGRDGDVIRSFTYDDNAPWPSTADGLGFSLVLKDPASNPDHANPFNWRASANVGGSPGAVDPPGPAGIVVSEALSNSDGALVDTIELFNPTGGDLDVGGWFLTDDENAPQKYQIVDPTIIPAGGYVAFDETHFNASGGVDPDDFALSATGDEVFLFSANPATDALTGYVHGFAFGAAANNVAFIRHVDSTDYEHFVAQADPGTSFGGVNEPFRVGEVVITELHYNPKTIDPLEPFVDEFIEIQNISDAAVPLFDPDNPDNTWVVNGAAFAFPPAASLAPGEVALVVSIDPETFRTTYLLPAELQIFGPFSGSLSDGGETITLERPTAPSPETPLIVPLIDVDAVRYDDDPPWTTLPDGGNGDGSSLNRLVADNFGSDPQSWTAAEPTPGTAFTIRHVVGRRLFYGGSTFDTPDHANAIAVDKSPLLPGETATLANYTGYEHGINGLIIDLLNPTAAPTAGDFTFRVGNVDDTASWQPAPPTASFTVDAAGPFGSTRVTITWTNGDITGQWLETTIAASLTGTADVFYFGNAIGETGNAPSNALVTAADLIAIRNHPRGEANRADITNPYDINRDRLVDAVDAILARNNAVGPFNALRLIAPAPPITAPREAEGEQLSQAHRIDAAVSSRIVQPSILDRSEAEDEGVAHSGRYWIRPPIVMREHAAPASHHPTQFNVERRVRALGRQSTESLPEQLYAELDDALADLFPLDRW